MKKTTNDLAARYDTRVVIIHWISFLLIAALVPTGKILRDTPVGAYKMSLYQYHLVIGSLVFLMTIYRVFLFFTKARPPRLDMGWIWHNRLVVWVQRSFYLALLALGISGLAVAITTGLGEAVYKNEVKNLPTSIDTEIFEVHEVMANILIVLFFAHVGGVILHYFRHKENVLQRIFFK
jgi:cytochrome b561